MTPFFEGSNPQRPFSIIKKGPRWDPSLKLNWRRAGDSNPRCPFGAYSLSRRAPSASRSALRNSRSIVTKQPRMGKREFGAIPFLPFPYRLQQIVAHIRNCKRNTAIARRLNQSRIDQTFAIRPDFIRRQSHLFGNITVRNLAAFALRHRREILKLPLRYPAQRGGNHHGIETIKSCLDTLASCLFTHALRPAARSNLPSVISDQLDHKGIACRSFC